jgi:hypothetical protein
MQSILNRELQFFEPLNFRQIGPTARQLRADFIIKPTVNGEKTISNNGHNATPCFSVTGSERLRCGCAYATGPKAPEISPMRSDITYQLPENVRGARPANLQISEKTKNSSLVIKAIPT